ncbi:hypothetical protein Pelo_252 [Pelomyxa schiedti]|nr:hypothetical protein Pelo_252 [Pelomyxa schiedti]
MDKDMVILHCHDQFSFDQFTTTIALYRIPCLLSVTLACASTSCSSSSASASASASVSASASCAVSEDNVLVPTLLPPVSARERLLSKLNSIATQPRETFEISAVGDLFKAEMHPLINSAAAIGRTSHFHDGTTPEVKESILEELQNRREMTSKAFSVEKILHVTVLVYCWTLLQSMKVVISVCGPISAYPLTLKPIQQFWLELSTTPNAPVLSIPELLYKSLQEGWNLIGSSIKSLREDHIPTDLPKRASLPYEAVKAFDAIEASCATVTGGSFPSYIQQIVIPFPGDIVFIDTPGVSETAVGFMKLMNDVTSSVFRLSNGVLCLTAPSRRSGDDFHLLMQTVLATQPRLLNPMIVVNKFEPREFGNCAIGLDGKLVQYRLEYKQRYGLTKTQVHWLRAKTAHNVCWGWSLLDSMGISGFWGSQSNPDYLTVKSLLDSALGDNWPTWLRKIKAPCQSEIVSEALITLEKTSNPDSILTSSVLPTISRVVPQKCKQSLECQISALSSLQSIVTTKIALIQNSQAKTHFIEHLKKVIAVILAKIEFMSTLPEALEQKLFRNFTSSLDAALSKTKRSIERGVNTFVETCPHGKYPNTRQEYYFFNQIERVGFDVRKTTKIISDIFESAPVEKEFESLRQAEFESLRQAARESIKISCENLTEKLQALIQMLEDLISEIQDGIPNEDLDTLMTLQEALSRQQSLHQQVLCAAHKYLLY